MPKGRRHTPEQIITLLQQIGACTQSGKRLSAACYEAGISELTYYRWRGEYGTLTREQSRRLSELQEENERLRRIIAVLDRDQQQSTESPGNSRTP